MTTAKIIDLPFADYLANPAFGSSDLRAFRTGPPSRVMWGKANRTESTHAMKFGTGTHCRLLTRALFERELFEQTYIVRPGDDRGNFRTKVGRAWRDEQVAAGRVVLTTEELMDLRGASDAAAAKLGSFLDLSNAEKSIFWSADGIDCKCRPDWFRDGEAIYDFKVTHLADKPFRALMFGAYNAGWTHQLAHGRVGLEAVGIHVKAGRIVAVSPNPPHYVHLLEVTENDLDFLELDNLNTRKGMAACVRANHWPGTPDKWTTIELPASAAFTETDLEGAEEALPL